LAQKLCLVLHVDAALLGMPVAGCNKRFAGLSYLNIVVLLTIKGVGARLLHILLNGLLDLLLRVAQSSGLAYTDETYELNYLLISISSSKLGNACSFHFLEIRPAT
jgi:hypothetical protein